MVIEDKLIKEYPLTKKIESSFKCFEITKRREEMNLILFLVVVCLAETKIEDVLICDNDNVTGNGNSLGVMGKARYMAPEVVRGATPDKVTDRYSLAVILYLLLIGNHPLEGAKTNVPVLTSKYEKRFLPKQNIRL